MVSGRAHVNLVADLIFSVAYKRAYDQVSGKCTPFYDILYYSRRSGIQFIASMLVPKSIAEVAEVCDVV